MVRLLRSRKWLVRSRQVGLFLLLLELVIVDRSFRGTTCRYDMSISRPLAREWYADSTSIHSCRCGYLISWASRCPNVARWWNFDRSRTFHRNISHRPIGIYDFHVSRRKAQGNIPRAGRNWLITLYCSSYRSVITTSRRGKCSIK